MRTGALVLMSLALLSGVATDAAGAYTTPNTGVHWNMDSLVVYSAGTVTGAFPNYSLIDVVTISPNDRLEILPGSIVTVSQGASIGITVLGTLSAIGTAVDSIRLQGAVPTAGSHRGFRFEDSAIDSLCVIAFCNIRDAVEGVHCLNANPTITNSLFTNNSSNGVRCFAASPIVRNCLFIENRQSAITANLGSSPVIEDNIFAYNNAQNTGARNQIAIGAQGVNNPIIRRNEIFNQNYYRAGAISLANIEAGGGCAAIVEHNYLHDNSFGILSQGPNMTPLIRYNRIENNRINPDPLVSGSGISVQTGGASNAPIITGNSISGNYWGITIVSASGLTSSPQPNLGNLANADTSDDGWNIFMNNHNGGTVYQLYNNGTMDITAQNNYWGSTDSTEIEGWIVHHPDSTVFGTVNYKPFGMQGLGIPDSFIVRQINLTEVALYWSFATHAPSAGVRILVGADTLSMSVAATLPDTQSTFSMMFPYQTGHYYGLSSFTRFGEGDTTFRFFVPILPSVTESGELPGSIRLSQNFPNPFNPGTSIAYTLPRSVDVRLEVLDLAGRTVEFLVHGMQPAGRHTAKWNAEGHASGIYFVRLTAGNDYLVRKVLLMK